MELHAEAPQKVATPPSPSPAVPNKPIPSTSPAAQPSAAAINCNYKIPPETKKVDQSLVITWTEKAVTQSFDFDPNNMEAQLQKLQPCFTEQGWTGFNTALQKSGNLEAIKSQKLTVSSQVQGQTVVVDTKDNQWKLNIPLQVVYQNEKEKVTQLLSVDVTVGRKATGDLGISQMIAVPRGTMNQGKSETPTEAQSSSSNDFPPNTTTPPLPTEQPATPATAPSQPTMPENRSSQPTPTPTTPGQPTLPGNRSNQPSLPPNH
jgi:hypothetical protein